VLVVHAAPVTRELLEQHPRIKLVSCLRGGAVNVDLDAARDLGVAVVNTPGKNAESVADLTLVSIQMLLRGIGPAAEWLRDRARDGQRHLDSTFMGGQWIAREPRGLTLGLIGLGAVGRLVAEQASAFGMNVIAYDPYVTTTTAPVALGGLDEVATHSDVVSIHAKSTDDNRHLIGEDFISSMKRGGIVINTARQSLLDEEALLNGLRSGHLAGAALDVCEPDGHWPELALMPNVLITPHLGGATLQTQQRGLEMAVADIQRFIANEPLLHQVA
jgi:D-3-phosphoglycerate dehydrogenase / 2-oxoglutarate reductase